MYNKLFSEQWVFDRCVEGYHFQFIIPTIFTAIVIISLFFLFKKLHFSNLKLTLSLVGLSIFMLPLSLFLVQVVGYFVIGCSAGAFWKGVMTANELYTKVKYECKKNNCPKSEKELAQLDPNLYRTINVNAKSKYTYNPKTKKFIWYVRSSKYYMVSFEDNGFGVYKIPDFLNIKHWGGVPEFKGQKGELPN